MNNMYWVALAGSAGLMAVLLRLIVKVTVPESYVALLYRNGRFRRRLAPGRYYLPRIGTQYTFVDMRWRVLLVGGQEVITQDNISLKLSLAVTWRISDPERSAHVVQDSEMSLRTAVQLALRSAAASRKAEQIIESRGTVGGQILPEVAGQTGSFGVEVQRVDVRDIMFPGELKRIFAEVVRAQQEGRAALERARGESAALRNLANAARLIDENPALMDIRLLQTVGSEGGNTLVMGWPQGIVPVGQRRQTPRSGSDEAK
jgi:regulator of protease activity HflC (stomatin/prohibitin superfamily)